MEMRKEEIKKQELKMGKVIVINDKGNTIYDIEEIQDFLYHRCYSTPDISINNEEKFSTNLKWIRKNIDTKLSNILSIRYINENQIEIKYINRDVVNIFAD